MTPERKAISRVIRNRAYQKHISLVELSKRIGRYDSFVSECTKEDPVRDMPVADLLAVLDVLDLSLGDLAVLVARGEEGLTGELDVQVALKQIRETTRALEVLLGDRKIE